MIDPRHDLPIIEAEALNSAEHPRLLPAACGAGTAS